MIKNEGEACKRFLKVLNFLSILKRFSQNLPDALRTFFLKLWKLTIKNNYERKLKVRRNLIAIIAFILTSSCVLFAQGTKVGYIDSQSILTQLPEAIKAQGDVQAAIDKIKGQIDSIGQVYQTTLADYQKQANLMTDAKKKTAQEKIMAMEKDYNDLRAQLDANGQVAQLNRKLMNPIVEKIKVAVEEIAKQAGVQLVLEKSEQLQVVWYAEPSMDLTFKVLDKLKTGK